MKEFISKKVIISGNIVEIYTYEKGYMKGGDGNNPNGRTGGSESLSDEEKKENREKVLSRARKTVRRLINANAGQYGSEFTSKFLTLTFSDHVTEIPEANHQLKLFIKRLNWDIFSSRKGNVKYIAVPEFTKKGRIHYHIILFNVPYVKSTLLEKIWSNGFIKINKITHVDNLGAYVCKYMTKDVQGLQGYKSYLPSQGLFKPTEITENERVANLQNSLPSQMETYNCTFENDHLGVISYKQYIISTDS